MISTRRDDSTISGSHCRSGSRARRGGVASRPCRRRRRPDHLGRTAARHRGSTTKGRPDAAAMKALALDPARASMAARYADRRFAASADTGTDRGPQARAVQHLVRIVPPLRRRPTQTAWQLPRRRGAAALRGRHGLRRAVPAADPADRPRSTARAPTTHSRRAPTMSAARGPSVPPRAATRISCRNWAPCRISSAWSRPGARLRHRDRARHRISVRARSSLRARASRMVPAPSRRQRAIRGEPAQEVSGHLSVRFRERRLARVCGRSSRASWSSGSRRASASFASTTRTPSLRASGSG